MTVERRKKQVHAAKASGRDVRPAGAGTQSKKAAAGDLVLVGKFGAPQGIKGEVRIRSFTEDPMAIASYAPLTDGSGEHVYRVLQARLAKNDMLIAKIEGISDRSEAETLTNCDLYIRRDQLPEPEDEEFYYADLIGLDARLQDGSHFGRVIKIENFGAGDILEILGKNDEFILIPFTRTHVPRVNQAEGFVIVDPPIMVNQEDDSN